MKLLWSGDAWAEYLHWQENDKDMVDRINELIRDTKRSLTGW